MQTEPDLEFRYDRTSGLIPLLLGSTLGVAYLSVFVVSTTRKDFESGNGLGALAILLAMMAFCIWIVSFGLKRILDRSVLLSVTADGIKDHRTGARVQWSEFHGIRLWVETTNGHLTSATMYIKVPKGDAYTEVAFSIEHLIRPYKEIAETVQKRALDALACV